MSIVDELAVEVNRHLAQEGLLIEHFLVNALLACEWSPEKRVCLICRWHVLDRLFP